MFLQRGDLTLIRNSYPMSCQRQHLMTLYQRHLADVVAMWKTDVDPNFISSEFSTLPNVFAQTYMSDIVLTMTWVTLQSDREGAWAASISAEDLHSP